MKVGVFGDSELALEIRAAVEALGFEPVAMVSGELERLSDTLDVLLAPLSWAANGGLSRALKLDLPVVVVARNVDQDDVRTVMGKGAKGVVTVPFENEQLLAQLRVAARLQRVVHEREVLDARVGRLEKAYAVAGDPLFFLDAEGRIAEANPACALAYGRPLESLIGERWDQLSSRPESRTAMLQQLDKHDVLKHGRTLRADGGGVIDCVLHRVRGELGEPAGTLVFERDLSEIQELKDAMASNEEAFAQLERRAAELERFTYTVSHDLKSPLVTIRGFVTRLVRDVKAGQHDKLDHRAARIEAAVSTMEALLDDLLRLSRVGRVAEPDQSVALDSVVDQVLLLLDGRIEEARASIRVDRPLPTVRGDPTRLREVFQNLVENAIRYRADRPLDVHIAGIDLGDAVEITVTDNGIGIAPAYHEVIFGLFEQVRRGEGTGIGLALVQRIIEVHRGTIAVESALGEGATFRIRLPQAPPETIA